MSNGVREAIRRAAALSIGNKTADGKCYCADCVETRRRIDAKYKAKRDALFAEVNAITGKYGIEPI
jgi:hypothetical protein